MIRISRILSRKSCSSSTCGTKTRDTSRISFTERTLTIPTPCTTWLQVWAAKWTSNSQRLKTKWMGPPKKRPKWLSMDTMTSSRCPWRANLKSIRTNFWTQLTQGCTIKMKTSIKRTKTNCISLTMSCYLKLKELRKCGNSKGTKGTLTRPLLSSKWRRSPQAATRERSKAQRSSLNQGQTCPSKTTRPLRKKLGTHSWTTPKWTNSSSFLRPTTLTTCLPSKWEINLKIWKKISPNTKMIWIQTAEEICQTETTPTCSSSNRCNRCNIKSTIKWITARSQCQGSPATARSIRDKSQSPDLKQDQLTPRSNQL